MLAQHLKDGAGQKLIALAATQLENEVLVGIGPVVKLTLPPGLPAFQRLALLFQKQTEHLGPVALPTDFNRVLTARLIVAERADAGTQAQVYVGSASGADPEYQ